MSEDVVPPLPEVAPQVGATPAPTSPKPEHDRGVKAWAASGSDAESKANLLPSGEVEGTARHPFRSVDREEYLAMVRPFGSIARRTGGAPTALVNLSSLTAIQGTVNRERLLAHLRDPAMNAPGTRAAGHGMMIDRPVVVKLGGKLFVHDGHHRLTGAHLRGMRTAKVRLVDLDAESGG